MLLQSKLTSYGSTSKSTRLPISKTLNTKLCISICTHHSGELMESVSSRRIIPLLQKKLNVMVRYFVSSSHKATFEIIVGEISLQCGCVPLDFIFWGCLHLCTVKDLGLEFACRCIILWNDMNCPSYCFKQCSSISICPSSGSSFLVWMSLMFQNQAHKFSGSLGGRFFALYL